MFGLDVWHVYGSVVGIVIAWLWFDLFVTAVF